MSSTLTKKFLTDVRFWIVLLFLVRLVGITNPPLETSHNWRQSITAMIARNFHEEGIDLLHPRVDNGGERSGIIGSEFPLFNSLIALTADVFGYAHWYGRLINLLISSIGLYFFFRTVELFSRPKTALYATLLLGLSIWFAFSRKIMPDTFSISLMCVGIFYGIDYLRRGKWWALMLCFLFTALGILSKIPALYLFSLLGILFFLQQFTVQRRLILSFTAFCSFCVGAWWYFVWVPHLTSVYGYHLFFPKTLAEGWLEIQPHWGVLIERFYFSAFHSFIASVIVLIGVFFLLRKKAKVELLAIAMLCLVFFLFIVKTGSVFPLHSYYIVPFVPVLAYIAACGLTELPKVYALALLLLMAAESIGNQYHDFFLKDEAQSRVELAAEVERYLPDSESKVVINGGENPMELYFAHRRGWTYFDFELQEPGFLDSLVQKGARYLIVRHSETDDFYARYTLIHASKDYSFYRLSEP